MRTGLFLAALISLAACGGDDFSGGEAAPASSSGSAGSSGSSAGGSSQGGSGGSGTGASGAGQSGAGASAAGKGGSSGEGGAGAAGAAGEGGVAGSPAGGAGGEAGSGQAGSGGAAAGAGGSGGSGQAGEAGASGGPAAGAGGEAGSGGSGQAGAGQAGAGAGQAGQGGAGAGGSGQAGQGGAGQAGAGQAGQGGAGQGGSGQGGAGQAGAGQGGAGGGTVGITIVQASSTATSNEETPSLAMPASPTSGNAIIVGITCISTFGNSPGDAGGDCIIPEGGVTDSWGSTYTRIIQGEKLESSQQGARGYIFVAYAVNNPGLAFSITVNPNGAPSALPLETQDVAWGAIEVAGLAAPPSVDATGASIPTGDANASVSTDPPTTQPNELAVAVLSVRSEDNNLQIKPQTGWQQHHVHNNNFSGPPGHSMVSRVLSEVGVVTHTWSHDDPTRSAGAVIATFKGASPD